MGYDRTGCLRSSAPAGGHRHHVLVRGLFGSLLPRHFRDARDALVASGARVSIAPTDPVATIEANAVTLGDWLDSLMKPGDDLVVLAHSRGGLESLSAIAHRPAIRDALRGLVLCQTARAGSPALSEIIDGSRRRDAGWRLAIRTIGGEAACREIGAPTMARLAAGFDGLVGTLPVVAVATWSDTPSRSLDAQHRRMLRLAPGVAHDGLFRTSDLIWPTARQVLLGRIDHSQPGMGGGGFDAGRFWTALAALAVADRPSAQSVNGP